MIIRTGYDIRFDCDVPVPMMLMLSVHPSRAADLRQPDTMIVTPAVPLHQYLDGFGNIVTRLVAPPGGIDLHARFDVTDTGLPDEISPGARQIAVENLPDEVLPFLLGSRYCETDRLSDLAWAHFGNIAGGWDRVKAVCAYAHDRIAFNYADARPTRTALEAHEERIGVCRDFAHLAVTLCRCLNIPARYCTGYLGDIGVPFCDDPMDFSAWFDVFLDGRWFTFDARHNKTRMGRILMARGRDATDVAISNSFGIARLTRFDIVTVEV